MLTGLPLHDKKPTPRTYQTFEINTGVLRQLTLHFCDRSSADWAKPDGAEIRWDILLAPTENPVDALTHSAFSTRSLTRWRFRATSGARRAYIYLRWENPTGEKDPGRDKLGDCAVRPTKRGRACISLREKGQSPFPSLHIGWRNAGNPPACHQRKLHLFTVHNHRIPDFVMQPFDNGSFDKRFEDIYKPAIEECGLEAYRVDKDISANKLDKAIIDGIKNAAMCFIDISLDNPNVWYELGYATAPSKEIIMICLEKVKERK